ncbi:MAG: neutral/alkaline non-lysosomal ceramidase N-terminal domain-containing protein [Anditalea sp.]
MWRKLIKILAWTTGLLLLLVLLTLTTVDWSDYKEQDYYHQTMKAIDSLQFQGGSSDFLLAGWATINATPSEPQSLVGYKPRGKYEFVQDSSYIKTLVLNNGSHSIAYLNYELLIIHPTLAKRVENSIQEKLSIDKVYFTATHTHSGMGGYIPGLMGKIAFGGYDEAIVKMLEEKSVMGIRSAMATMDTVQVQYKKTAAQDFVMNRFIAEDPVDPYFRQLIFTKAQGETGTFITYSAHATCLSGKFMGLSGDYPQYLMDYLEEDNADFALFAAGTVGSHRPMTNGNEIPSVKQYAHSLDSVLTHSTSEPIPVTGPAIKFATIPLALRDAHYRISDNIRLRPWVFNSIFGETSAHFDIVLLGNTLMISSSGEISGVFYEEWEKKAAEKGLNLIITTFNGGYIGYITPDRYYNYDYHEVRDMNWYGPYNGAYFDEIISGIIEIVDGP